MGIGSPSPPNQSSMRYRMTPTPQGFRLDIWEVPMPTARVDKPFLFQVSYTFATLALAEAALNWYLDHNPPTAPVPPTPSWLATARHWFRRLPLAAS